MIEPVPARTVWRLAGLGFVLRLFVAVLTGIPAEDGVNYLWMAEQLAAGDAALALSEVFPPLLPLLIVPFLWLGLPAFFAGQLVGAIVGALCIVVVVRLTERIAPQAALQAGLFMLVAHLAVRFGARIYSEPVFHLFSGLALCFAVSKRYGTAGLFAGIAFWARPEAALIPVAFAVFDVRRAWRGLVPFAVLVLALGAWRDSLGLGFVFEAKAALHNERLWGDGFSLGGFVRHFFGNLLEIPWLWVEAFGLLGLLAWYGMWKGERSDVRPLLLILVLGIIVICQFLPRRRFLVSWLMVVLPFAARGFLALSQQARLPVFCSVLLITGLMAMKLQDSDKYFERQMGNYLGSVMRPGEQIVSDMTRVIYFAGRRPNPPRHFTVEELAQRALEPDVRFLVLGSRRPTTAEVVSQLGDQFKPMVLRAEQVQWCSVRGMLVLERSE